MQRGWFALGLVVVVGLVASACGQEPTVSGSGGQTEQTGEAEQPFAIEDANDHGAADLSGQSETSLELDDFYFEPTVLIGEPGQTTNIELENEGTTPHTFTLDDGSVDEELQPGDKVELDVSWPDSGNLRFTCRFHAGEGMMGALSTEGDLGATAVAGEAEDDGGGGGGGDDSGPGYG
jgi:plastocyanin